MEQGCTPLPAALRGRLRVVLRGVAASSGHESRQPDAPPVTVAVDSQNESRQPDAPPVTPAKRKAAEADAPSEAKKNGRPRKPLHTLHRQRRNDIISEVVALVADNIQGPQDLEMLQDGLRRRFAHRCPEPRAKSVSECKCQALLPALASVRAKPVVENNQETVFFLSSGK